MKTPAPARDPASTGTTSGDPVDRPVSDDPDVTSSAQIRLTGSDELIHNVKLACSGIYGMVLRRGETFSFNSLVGPNTQDAGYQEAFDGRGESITGGGVSIVASALWLAVKDMDGVTVTKKSTYGKAYSQSYVASAADAIRTDYEGGADFRFRYKGRGSITVYTYVEDGWLICEVRRNNS